ERLPALRGLGEGALVEARDRRVELLEVGADRRAEPPGLLEAAGGPRAVHVAVRRLARPAHEVVEVVDDRGRRRLLEAQGVAAASAACRTRAISARSRRTAA